MEVQPTLVSHTIKLYKQNLKNKSIIGQLNTINYDLYDNKKLILNLLNTDTAIINDLIINKSAILGYDIKKDDYDYSIVNKKYVDSLVSHAVDPSRTLYLTNPDISLKCDGNIECYNNLIVSNCINTDKINCTDDINIYGNIFIKNINDPYTIKLSNNNILLLNDDVEILKYTANDNTFTSNIDLIIHGNVHFDNINIKNINISGLINNLNINDMNNEIKNNTSDIITINEEINDLSGRIDTNTSDITTINGKITKLSGRIDTNTSNITTINGKITDLSNKISTNTSDITTINEEIRDLTSKISTNTSDITTINGKIIDLSGRIDTNTSNISNINEEISDLSGRISTNTSNITSINEEITNLSGQIDTNTSDITNINEEISDLSGRISTNTSDITSINGKITDLTSKISTNTSDITTINEEISDLTNKISTNTSDITIIKQDITNLKQQDETINSDLTNYKSIVESRTNSSTGEIITGTIRITNASYLMTNGQSSNSLVNKGYVDDKVNTAVLDTTQPLTITNTITGNNIISNGSLTGDFLNIKTSNNPNMYRIYEKENDPSILIIDNFIDTQYNLISGKKFIFNTDGRQDKLSYIPSTNTIDVLDGDLTLNGDLISSGIKSNGVSSCTNFVALKTPSTEITPENTAYRVRYEQQKLLISHPIVTRYDCSNDMNFVFAAADGKTEKLKYTPSTNTFEVLNGNLTLNGSYSLPTNGSTDTSLVNKKYVDDKVKTAGIDTTQPLTITNTITGNNIITNGGELKLFNSQGRLLETTRQHETYKIATSIMDNKVYDIENNSHIILKSNAQTEKLRYTPSINTIDVLDGNLTLNGNVDINNTLKTPKIILTTNGSDCISISATIDLGGSNELSFTIAYERNGNIIKGCNINMDGIINPWIGPPSPNP